MNYSVTCRLRSVTSCFRRILRQTKYLHPLEKKVPLREFSSAFPSRYYEDKYSEIRRRLLEVPCKDLLNKEVDRVQYDLFYENDERLVDLLKWCSKVFDCNTRTGRFVRADALLKAYCAYGFSITDTTWNQWDSDGWKSAVILAWCVELIASYINILDDIVDQSVLRRQEPCWYKKPEVGLSAIHDALVLQWGIFKLLRKHFAGSKCYMNVLHEFLQANLELAYGQCMDTINPINQKSRFDAFTFEKYETLTEYKAAHYGYRLPVHLAMHMAGGYSKEEFDFTTKLCMKLGLYFQSQDDRLDYVLPIEQSGLKGNDIRDGRLTWFSGKFFEEASESMKEQFLENYGVDDEDAVDKILELYKKENMLERFQEFDKQLYAEISTLIESTDDVKAVLFYDLFHQVQNRKINLAGSIEK